MSECREETSVKLNEISAADVPSEESSDAVSLEYAVAKAVHDHLQTFDGQVTDLYDLTLSEVEAPLLSIVMERTSYNQSRAAKMLGLNRGTLRKKLKRYGLL